MCALPATCTNNVCSSFAPKAAGSTCPTGYCDGSATSTCFQCLTSSDCPAPSAADVCAQPATCTNNVCSSTLTPKAAGSTCPTGYCNGAATSSCFQCVSSSDCGAATPLCVSNACVAAGVRTFATVATSTGAYGIAAQGASTASLPYAYGNLEMKATTYNGGTAITQPLSAVAVDLGRSALFVATSSYINGYVLRCSIDGVSMSSCQTVSLRNTQNGAVFFSGSVAGIAASSSTIYFVLTSLEIVGCPLGSGSNALTNCVVNSATTTALPVGPAPKSAEFDVDGRLVVLIANKIYKCPITAGTVTASCMGSSLSVGGASEFALAPSRSTIYVAVAGSGQAQPWFYSFVYNAGSFGTMVSDATTVAAIGGASSVAAAADLLAYVKSNALWYAPVSGGPPLTPNVAAKVSVTLSNNINVITSIASV